VLGVVRCVVLLRIILYHWTNVKTPGTLYSGFLAEIISRKYAIIANTGIFIIGVVVQTTAAAGEGHGAMLGGRFVTGMGVGSLSMVVPMVSKLYRTRFMAVLTNSQYVAECAPPEVRGLLIALQQFAIEFGILISFWINYGCNNIGKNAPSPTGSWLYRAKIF